MSRTSPGPATRAVCERNPQVRPVLTLIVPGALNQRTGGYRYDARLLDGLRARGWQVQVCELDGTFPQVDEQARAAMDAALRAQPDGARVLVDGLALGGLPELAHNHASRLRLIALVHHPLGDETGLDETQAVELHQRELKALQAVRLVITTSDFTARRLRTLASIHAPAMGLVQRQTPRASSGDRSSAGPRAGSDMGADAGLDPGTGHPSSPGSIQVPIAVVEPGVEPAPCAAADHQPPRLLCVATLTRRKGHEVLLRALAGMVGLPWHLNCVGSAERDVDHANHLRSLVMAFGLAGRVDFVGELDDAALTAAYAGADVFVLPSFYEGYGMVIDEALAHGLPIVSTGGGALAQTVPAGAGLLVPPGDVDALAGALRLVLTDGALRARLRAGARQRRIHLRSWTQVAAAFESILEGV